MYKLISILIFLFSFNLVHSKVEVISSDDSHMIISYSPEFIGIEAIRTNDGFDTYLPQFKNAYKDQVPQGLPTRLIESENITVPGKDLYSIKQIGSVSYERIDNLMAPMPSKTDNIEELDFILSDDYFNRELQADFKSQYIGIARGRHLVRIDFAAAYFDSYSGEIKIPQNIILRIDFNNKNSKSLKGSSSRIDPAISLNHTLSSKWIKGKSLKSKYQLTNDRILSDGTWLNFKIDKDGIYRISSSELSSVGITIPKDKLNTIKIFNHGGRELPERFEEDELNELKEQSAKIVTNSQGDLSEIIFFAKGPRGFELDGDEVHRYINTYSNSSNFLLTWGGDQSKSYEEQSYDGEIEYRPSTYINRYLFEEEFENPYPAGGGRQYFGQPFYDKVFTTNLHDLDRNGEVFYRFSLAHKSSSNGTFDITESGNPIVSNSLIGPATGYTVARRTTVERTIPAIDISNDNRSTLEFLYQGGGANPGYLDYYEIHYPRNLFAINDEILLYAEENEQGAYEYNIGGFSNGTKYGFDITDPTDPIPLRNYASDNDKFIIRTELDSTFQQFYVSNKITDVGLSLIEFNGLRENKDDVDIIIITHPDLEGSANRFKNYKDQNSNLISKVYLTNHIFNEFAAGTEDVTAIRDFIRYAYLTWDVRPSYVVLWGDGHSDLRKISYREKNYVPPYLSLDERSYLSETLTTCFDDYYIRVDGNDDLIDLSIGRIPINSDSEGNWYVEKLDIYENRSENGLWRTRMTLIADDGKQGGGRNDGALHTRHAEEISNNYVDKALQQNKIYLIEYPTEYSSNGRRKPDAATDFVSSMREEGSLITNWTGHGNPRLWAHEQIFVQENTVKELDNLNKLSFITAATCEFGRFDQVTGQTASEELVLSEKGGAIAVFAATRLVFAGENSDLNNLFFDKLFQRNPSNGSYYSLGDVLYNVKQSKKGSNDEKYFIMGDPTMKLILPEQKLEIVSINNINTSDIDEDITLEGLSKIEINGRVLNQNDSFDSTFNGNLIITLFDGDIQYRLEEEGYKYNFMKYGGLLKRSTVNIVNGEFSANFTLPKDISYSENNGRLFAYAETNDGLRFAKGSFEEFVISGIDSDPPVDTDGPIMSLYLDSREFIEGDIVSKEPLLIVDVSDSLGVNSTGVGIGHKIEAWVNDEPGSFDLTNSFSSWVTDTTNGGTATIVLKGLEPGLNKVTVRVWDILNNYSISETYFNIVDDVNSLWIGEIGTYPNPFEFETNITFRHNLTPPYDVDVEIYSSNGAFVRKLSAESIFVTYKGSLLWDGLDQNGNSIPQGAYVYKVNLRNGEGESVTKAGMVSVKIK